MLTTLLIIALSQTGACKAGSNCSVQSIKTTRVGGNGQYGSLNSSIQTDSLTVNSSVYGASIYTSNGAANALSLQQPGGFVMTIIKDFVGQTASLSVDGQWITKAGYNAPLALASFPACNGGNAGQMIFDSTNNQWKFCSSATSTWVAIGPTPIGPKNTSSSWTAWGSAETTVTPQSSNFYGAYRPSTATQSQATIGKSGVVVQSGVAGVGGGSVTLQLYNVTDSLEVDICTFVCNATARVPVACGLSTNSVLSSTKTYVWRIREDSCTTRPSGVVVGAEVVNNP